MKSISVTQSVTWRLGIETDEFCTEGNQATTDCHSTSQLIPDSTVQRTNKTSGASLLPLTHLEEGSFNLSFILSELVTTKAEV